MICSHCNQDLDVEQFYLRKDTGKRRSMCKKCVMQRNKLNRAKKPEQYAAADRKRYARNPEPQLKRCRERYRRDPEKKLASNKRVYENDKEKAFSYARKYREARKRATPKWADKKAIKMFYENRPDGYEVDHIYPIQGRTVCGLHVLNNLQYLTKQQNCAKFNYQVDMD